MKKDPWHRNRLIRDGILAAIHEAMKADSGVYILGEGAHMKVHFDAPQIEKEFPDKVITLPISEDANSNFAVGMSLAGLVPIVDVISSDFLYRTMDAICNTMAKAETVGEPRTMIVRSEFMTGGPTSGQRIEALFAHIPGLRVAVPSNPVDAYGLMKQALATKAVTVFFEDRMIEDASMPADLSMSMRQGSSPPLDLDAFVPSPTDRSWDGARVDQTGSHVTIVSYGITQRIIENALRGSVVHTLIDLRTLWPLDMETILKHARITNKLLIVEPDVGFLGIGAEIAAQVAEHARGVHVKRLGAPRVTIPACRELHDLMLPTVDQIHAALEDWT
jgi:pyruvate dehydrogenase E1 component beta subunit